MDYWFSGPRYPNHRRLEPICTWSAVNVIQLSVLIGTLEVRYRRKEICCEVWTDKKDTTEVCEAQRVGQSLVRKAAKVTSTQATTTLSDWTVFFLELVAQGFEVITTILYS